MPLSPGHGANPVETFAAAGRRAVATYLDFDRWGCVPQTLVPLIIIPFQTLLEAIARCIRCGGIVLAAAYLDVELRGGARISETGSVFTFYIRSLAGKESVASTSTIGGIAIGDGGFVVDRLDRRARQFFDRREVRLRGKVSYLISSMSSDPRGASMTGLTPDMRRVGWDASVQHTPPSVDDEIAMGQRKRGMKEPRRGTGAGSGFLDAGVGRLVGDVWKIA
ncbi:hypothetical protein CTA2_7987 [Colletotrichum tanaceti]|uniref:Uncharacterized protein n=1 Tax=Colletotrichum tanaceti TaxID=1306861 RepID=A0A4U6XCH3_9PEZI|nr:hypothetical protein CTA2_7987 [Colletotrichum tanaceti]TKW53441.1 hypothetical protein CTA1_6775 [Colletotrichum tanaceti]